MTKQKTGNAPATMNDVFSGVEASLGFAGAVMARVFPIYLRHQPLTAQNFEALQKDLESLAAEYVSVSPYSVIVMDTLLHTLEVDRDRILSEPGNTA